MILGWSSRRRRRRKSDRLVTVLSGKTITDSFRCVGIQSLAGLGENCFGLGVTIQLR